MLRNNALDRLGFLNALLIDMEPSFFMATRVLSQRRGF